MQKFPIDKFEERRTPFYYYDMDLLRRTVAQAKADAGDIRIHYAVKANANPAILNEMARAGLGADCVSGGEIALALESGFAAADIMFAGVGKTDREILLALDKGIGCLNVESVEELEVIAELAASRGVVAPVALRVNPNIDAHTHHYITTGLEENKFGIDLSLLDQAVDFAVDNPWLRLRGLHFHIGSQIEVYEPFDILCERIDSLVDSLAARGVELTDINVGGGLGIDYSDPDGHPVPDFGAYFGAFRRGLRSAAGRTVHCELGRSLTGQCGSLITRVVYVKKGVGKRFVIVDAGMTELIRPALYQASHLIQNISSGADATEVYDVVGPVCESSDCFAESVELPVTRRGDFIAIRSAGAYGEAMASSYNCRKLAPCMAE